MSLIHNEFFFKGVLVVWDFLTIYILFSFKDKMFLPTVCTKTVTYRRDKPEEINISKLQVNETFKCNS